MTVNTIEINSSILRPFGPSMLSVTLPPQHITKLIQMTDDNSHRLNHGEYLAGQIKSEPYLDPDELAESGFKGIFEAIGKNFIHEELSRNSHFKYFPDSLEHTINIKLTNAWCVSQYENEYNPLHYHTKCHLSAVLYLKIPEYTPRNLPGKQDIDGCIEFVNSAINMNGMLEAGQFLIRPEVGMLIMFPSNLLHTVYPFQGPDERRSIAFNLSYFLGQGEYNDISSK